MCNYFEKKKTGDKKQDSEQETAAASAVRIFSFRNDLSSHQQTGCAYFELYGKTFLTVQWLEQTSLIFFTVQIFKPKLNTVGM